MRKRFIIGCFLITAVSTFAQKKVINSEIIEDESLSDTLSVVDTLEIKELQEEMSQNFLFKQRKGGKVTYNLNDQEFPSKIDKKWVRELTNGSLYDSIEAIIDEDYHLTEVDFPELTTEILKKRLADLNARTPFNIEYTPSLENVIKSYLKRHKPTLERLMGLSEFYFP